VDEYRRVGVWVNQYDVFCGVVVDGVRLYQPQCRTAEECVEEILEDYRWELERLREPPQPALVIKIDPVEELLKEWPELGAFGTEWVRKWLVLRERLIEIAKVMRRFPWMVEVVRQRPMSILHPYTVEVYVARDGSEACISLTSSKAFCAQNGSVREVKLELVFSRYETYEEKIREVYRPKGLLAFAGAAREYVRML
jgi:acetone carboxylase gamma subunit